MRVCALVFGWWRENAMTFILTSPSQRLGKGCNCYNSQTLAEGVRTLLPLVHALQPLPRTRGML